jgi:CelD/BcsL family acetyltransferase involved in cellulose biosynthesis
MAQEALQFVSLEARSRPSVGHHATDSDAECGPVEFRLVRDLAGFAALEDEWKALHEASAEPHQVFQTFAWNWLWCRHYLPAAGAPGARLAVVTGRQAGQLVLVLPLVVERVAGVTQIGWMGDPVTQYGDALASAPIRSTGVMRAAWRFAVATTGADVANLRKVRSDAVTSTALDTLGGRIVARQEAPYAVFAGHQQFASYEAQLSAKGRKNRRRHLRRLQEIGDIRFTTAEGEEAVRLVRLAMELKRAWIASRGEVSRAFADKRFERFFVEAVSSEAQGTGCRISALRCNDEVAALEVTLDSHRHRFLHIGVYEPRFEKFGVGGLLLQHSLQESLAQGIETFDLLAPRYDYKMEFCTAAVEVRDYALAFTWRGWTYVNTWLKARAQLKRLVQSAPAPLRRLAGRVWAPAHTAG